MYLSYRLSYNCHIDCHIIVIYLSYSWPGILGPGGPDGKGREAAQRHMDGRRPEITTSLIRFEEGRRNSEAPARIRKTAPRRPGRQGPGGRQEAHRRPTVEKCGCG